MPPLGGSRVGAGTGRGVVIEEHPAIDFQVDVDGAGSPTNKLAAEEAAAFEDLAQYRRFFGANPAAAKSD